MPESNVYDFDYYHRRRWLREIEAARKTGAVLLSANFAPDKETPAEVIVLPQPARLEKN